jgi:hypothetical protein
MKKAAFMLSVLVLGAVVAFAGTISVPQYNDEGADTNLDLRPPTFSATFIALKNNTAVTQTYTILYYTTAGDNNTPGVNTFTIGPNSSRGWRPANTTDPNQGPGITVPSALSTVAGSATILYTDTIDPSGRVLILGSVTSNSSYAYALYPAQ